MKNSDTLEHSLFTFKKTKVGDNSVWTLLARGTLPTKHIFWSAMQTGLLFYDRKINGDPAFIHTKKDDAKEVTIKISQRLFLAKSKQKEAEVWIGAPDGAHPGTFKIPAMNKSLKANELPFTVVSITQANTPTRDGLQGRFVRFSSTEEATAFSELSSQTKRRGCLVLTVRPTSTRSLSELSCRLRFFGNLRMTVASLLQSAVAAVRTSMSPTWRTF